MITTQYKSLDISINGLLLAMMRCDIPFPTFQHRPLETEKAISDGKSLLYNQTFMTTYNPNGDLGIYQWRSYWKYFTISFCFMNKNRHGHWF